MKRLFTLVLGLTLSLGLRAQCPVSELKKGSSFEMTSYDAKERVTGRTVQTVTEVTTTGGTTTVALHQQQFDAKNKPVMESDYTLECSGGTLRLDMRAMSLSQSDQMKGMENMQMDVTADKLEMPGRPNVGQTLPDGSLTIKASDKNSGMAFMTMTTTITDRKVEALEKQTTPAGTFDCVRVAQTTKLDNKAMGIPIRFEFRSISWYSPSVGAVRTDSYRGEKLAGKVILTKFTK